MTTLAKIVFSQINTNKNQEFIVNIHKYQSPEIGILQKLYYEIAHCNANANAKVPFFI